LGGLSRRTSDVRADALPDATTYHNPTNSRNCAMLAWVYLFIAISLEVIGTISLKFSNGFTDWRFTVLSLSVYGLSFWVLALTLRIIPVGTAYAVWAGLGTASVALIGWLFLKEPMTALKAVFLLMIIGGVVGLKTISTEN
jgi:multidrug transporter EmrE-like cation transporter